jgi:hypothetical protein
MVRFHFHFINLYTDRKDRQNIQIKHNGISYFKNFNQLLTNRTTNQSRFSIGKSLTLRKGNGIMNWVV